MPYYVFYAMTDDQRRRAWSLLCWGGCMGIGGGLLLLALQTWIGKPSGPDWPWTPGDGYSLALTFLFTLLPLGAALFFWAVANYRVDRKVRRQEDGIARLDGMIRLWCLIWLVTAVVFGGRMIYVSIQAILNGWPTGVMHTLYLGTERITEVGYSADGDWILATTSNGRPVAWHAQRGQPLPVQPGSSKAVASACARTLLGAESLRLSTSDGKTHVELRRGDFSTWNGPLVVRNEQGNELQRFTPHDRPVNAIALTPEGQRLLTASDDQTVRLWDLRAKKELHKLIGHSAAVTCVQFAPNGDVAYSGDRDGRMLAWNLQDGKMLQEIGKGKHREVFFLSVSRDGRRLLSSGKTSSGANLCLWELTSGTLVAEFAPKYGLIDGPTALSPDGRWGLVTSGGMINVWRLEP